MDILQGVNYLYTSNGEQKGPVEGTQLVQLASEGHVLSTDHIWTEGLAEWVPAPTINQLAPLYQAQAQQEAAAAAAQAAAAQQVQAPMGYAQPDVQAQPERKPTQPGGAPTLARRGKTRPPGERSPLPGSTTGRTRPGATTGRTVPGQPGALRPGNVPAARGGMLMPAKKGAKPAMMIWLFFIGLISLPSSTMLPMLLISGGGEQPSDSVVTGTAIASIALSAAGMVCLLIYAIFTYIYLYRAWSHIQDVPGIARTTPGAAVGMLFVPFYNWYWIFNVFPGFTTDYNRYLEARGATQTARASQGLYITGLLVPFVTPFMMADMCKCINSIAVPTDPALQE